MKIVLVCTGNTCRSPMAEGLLKRELLRQSGHEVSSAGLYAAQGEPATPNAVVAMGEIGIDISSHRSSALNLDELEKADLVITMTAGHKDALLNRRPQLRGKALTLTEWVSEEGDLPDPYGGDLNIYRATAKELQRLVRKAVERLADSPSEP